MLKVGEYVTTDVDNKAGPDCHLVATRTGDLVVFELETVARPDGPSGGAAAERGDESAAVRAETCEQLQVLFS